MKKSGTKMMMLGLLTTALLLLLFAGCNNGSGLHTTTYTVTYDGNGATGGSAPTDSTTYTEGSTVTVLGNPGTLEKTSYTFAGWNAASDGSGETYVAGSTFTMGTADVTLYAVWSQNTHTLSFDANGGSGSMDSVAVAEGATVALPANTFTRTHYSFVGWATTGDGSVVYSDGGSYTMGTADVTLYAVWNLSMSAQWAKVVTGGGGKSSFNNVTVDADGNVCAAGYQHGTGTFTYGTGVSATGDCSENNAVVVKYDGSGVGQWAQVATGGGAASYLNGITVNADGDVYVAGYQHGTGTFTYGTGVSATGDCSENNAVVVKYNSSGVAQWAQVVTGGGAVSAFNGVTVDADGNVYAAGYQAGTGTFTYGTGVSATGDCSDNNSVVVKYNSSGVAQWAQVVTGGGAASYINGVTVNADGDVYVAGYQCGTGTFAYGTGVSATGDYSGNNSVVVKYNSSGVAQWAQAVTGGGGASSFNGVTVDADGNVYAAGYQYATGTFAYGTGVSAIGDCSDNNSVVVKYNSSGVAQWAQAGSGGSGSSFCSVTVEDGTVYAAGYQYGTSTYTYGTGVSATGDWSGYIAVVVMYDSSGVAQCAEVVTGGEGASSFNSVTVDGDGNAHVSGYQYGTGTFTYSTGVSATGDYGYWNSMVVKYQYPL